MAMDDLTCIFEKNLKEEWVWVTGYKGTDKDMKCRDYQYEIGKPYSIPDNEAVVECLNGFHLCKELGDVFNYYDIGDNRRYFEVSARVRNDDLEAYGRYRRNKLVAREIVFIRELEVDEILQAYLESRYGRLDPDYRSPESKLQNWTDARKHFAIEYGVEKTIGLIATDHLVTLGYSLPFARYVVACDAQYVAAMVASQEDLSMDMRVMLIFDEIKRQEARRGSEPYSYRSRRR